jgi:hypothetical protein
VYGWKYEREQNERRKKGVPKAAADRRQSQIIDFETNVASRLVDMTGLKRFIGLLSQLLWVLTFLLGGTDKYRPSAFGPIQRQATKISKAVPLTQLDSLLPNLSSATVCIQYAQVSVLDAATGDCVRGIVE